MLTGSLTIEDATFASLRLNQSQEFLHENLNVRLLRVGQELFASIRHGWASCSYQRPFLAFRIRSSDRLDSEIMALRRTPPQTTTSATMHIKSWHSNELSLRPAAFWKRVTVNLKRRSRGSGPLARPPKVFRIEPLGRTADRSHVGISPPYSKLMS